MAYTYVFYTAQSTNIYYQFSNSFDLQYHSINQVKNLSLNRLQGSEIINYSI